MKPQALVAESPERLRLRGLLKWTHFPPDVLPLWVAETDFAPADLIMDAVRDAVERGSFGYAPDASVPLSLSTAAFLEGSCGLAVDPADVKIIGDVMHGVRLAIDYLTPPGSPVVLPVPAYTPFFEILEVCGRERSDVPMIAEPAGADEGAGFAGRGSGRAGGSGGAVERYRLDLDGIDRALAAGARAVILTNPHNPTGRAFTAGELTALAAVVDRHGARVISDEIHAPLVLDGKHLPYVVGGGETARAHSVTLVSASKTWNLPGLKCAQLITHSVPDREALTGIPHVATFGASPLGIVAAIAAYDGGEPYRQALLSRLRANRDLLGDLLAEQLPFARWTEPEATYLSWIDLGAYAERAVEGTGKAVLGEQAGAGKPGAGAVGGPSLHQRILEDGRVALNAGTDYGARYEHHVRLNFATSPEVLTEAVHRIATALA